MDKQTHLNETLAARFLAGEASPDEAIQLNDWIQESNENKIYFKELELAWTLNSGRTHSAPIKTEAWHSLQSNLTTRTRHVVNFTPYRIAAAILVIITLSAVIYFSRPSANTPTLSWNIELTNNEVTSIVLLDGTSVTINRKSKLMWPQQFELATREVKLEGEAFFDVTHDPDKPFVISVDEINIKVLGTAFNVLQDIEHKEIRIDVARGKVMMYNSNESIIVEAGMEGVYQKETKRFLLLKMRNANTMAYATHSLSFSGSTLNEVCEQLSKSYGVKFNFKNAKLKECQLTTEFQNKSLPFIMDVIAESLNINYYIQDNTIYISGDGCR